MGASQAGSLTMPYQEWIRFGIDPVLPLHFWALSKPQARAFFAKVMESIPERMRQLEELIHERRPKLKWRPDFTEKAFGVVVDVLTECVETRSRTPTEVEKHRAAQPDIFKTIGSGIRDWEGTDRSYSIAFDVGIYWALDLQSKEPRMQWKLCGGKSTYLRNQPILEAPNPRRIPPYLSTGPLDNFATTVLRIADNDPHQYTWLEIYRHWIGLISRYQQNYPVDVPLE